LTEQWTLSASDGEVLLHTGVIGTAARMGHRLTIAMRSWRATVDWDGDDPSGVEVTIDLDSLDVVHGEGGMTPLSGAEKTLVRTNALKTLQAKRFPQATFRSSAIDRNGDTLRLVGTLQIAGRSGGQTVDVRVEPDGAEWRIAGEAVVRHSDFGIKQYSMLMGAMKVADEVEVTIAVARRR
jgi:polyisoprenoid-binding protein YceI